MFDNLTKEIILYSLIPVAIIALIGLILLIIFKVKKNNKYKLSYIIKIFLIFIISLVLPLITGYSLWRYHDYLNKGIVSSKIVYLIVLLVLVVSLIGLLITVSVKLYKSFNYLSEEY